MATCVIMVQNLREEYMFKPNIFRKVMDDTEVDRLTEELQIEDEKSELPRGVEPRSKHESHRIVVNSASGKRFFVCQDCCVEVTEK